MTFNTLVFLGKYITLAAAFSAAYVTFFALSAHAVSTANFNAGRIIDDSVFTRSDSMSVAEIQAFLNSKVPSCDTQGAEGPYAGFRTKAAYAASKAVSPPFTCLKSFKENGLTSAEIIYNTGKKYKINPQVLIVLIQKEQGLITDDWPWYIQYRSATGYGCPDTGPNHEANCNSSYFGFTNQVDWSAKMFRAIMNDSPTWYTPYILGNNFIQYDVEASCGGSTVRIQNRATQALYNYTPYQPSQAALSAGYGSAEPCGAYGNRNFWLYFNDWFGTTHSNDSLSAHPAGSLVVIDGAVYYVENSSKHWIKNSSVFVSNGWSWGWLKPGTTGDRNLPTLSPIDHLKPGMLYRSATSGVYVSIYEDGKFVKQLVSYDAFTKLGYKWDRIQVIPENELPSGNSSSILTNSNRHPDGTLVIVRDAVYMIDHSTLRHVTPSVFTSNNWNWGDVVRGTSGDAALPIGARMLLRKGAPIRDGAGYYIVDIPPTGYEKKKPIGPWSCYEDVFKYSAKDAQYLIPAEMPLGSGARITC